MNIRTQAACRSDYRSNVFLFVFGALLITLASSISFAKGPTTKITIEGASLAKPVEITDPTITKDFRVFAGPGTSTNEPQSLIMNWAAGKVTPPSGLESYRVSFFVDGYEHPYVVLYAFDPANAQGYAYLPGKNDEWYRTNTMILRHVEGNWFLARARWENVARPLIEQQRTPNSNK